MVAWYKFILFYIFHKFKYLKNQNNYPCQVKFQSNIYIELEINKINGNVQYSIKCENDDLPTYVSKFIETFLRFNQII